MVITCTPSTEVQGEVLENSMMQTAQINDVNKAVRLNQAAIWDAL